jgi:hypothetical protein
VSSKQLAFRVRDLVGVATARILGRSTSGSGRAEELTASQVRTLLDVSTTSEIAAAYQPIGDYATLVGGLVPAGQLPSYVDDVIEGANLAAFPATGESGKIYVALDTSRTYRWSGSAYVELTDSTAVWGSISGALSNQTDLQTALNGKQATLVSGTNIKTINSTSLLGSGDIVVSASPAGSSGQVQFNNAGSFGGAAAIAYAATGTHLVITAQSSTAVPECIKLAASQTGNAFEIRNVSDTLLSLFNSSGWLSLNQAGAPAYPLDINGTIRCGSLIVMGGSRNVLERATLDGDTANIIGQFDTAVILRGDFPSKIWAKFKTGEGYFGDGQTNATAANYRLQATGGSGTNNAASNLTLAPGRSTGNATPATLTLQRTVAGSSGSTLQTLSDAVTVDSSATTVTGLLAVTGLFSLGVYTVATLPSASANAGRIAQVTDSSITTNGSAVSGSGSNRVMVFSNGTNWDVVVA